MTLFEDKLTYLDYKIFGIDVVHLVDYFRVVGKDLGHTYFKKNLTYRNPFTIVVKDIVEEANLFNSSIKEEL